MRRAAPLLALALALLLAAPAAAANPERAAAQRLAERHVPIMELREETDPPCETSAEQYQPTSVDTVLGNPTVELTHEVPGQGLLDVGEAPTAAELAGKGEGWFLDLEGSPLGNTCVYARAFAKLRDEGRAPVVVYAHIAREPGHSGFALQYWFYWYFNQFNDLHESDWEGMQLTFEADDPTAALAEEPSEVIVFQHSGGERADWEDAKVQKEGTHPIVYSAAGSHATFYGSAIYVENGRHGSGLGCDNTTEPLRRVRPRAILLPDNATDSGRFAWLGYDGRWGEREKGYNNGPTGPQTKTQWGEPFTWMDEQRSSSPRLPGGALAGPPVAKAFCSAVASASKLVNLDARSRPAALATLGAILAGLALFVGFTRWRPVDLENLRRRRAFGQLLRAAFGLYRRQWRVLLPVAGAALVVTGATNLAAEALSEHTFFGELTGVRGFDLLGADLLESIVRPLAAAVVAAIAIVVVRELLAGGEPGFRSALAGVRERFWRVVGAQLLATAGVLLLAATVIGLPFAIWKLVGWAFVQQEILLTDKGFAESFRGSSTIVRGRWLRSARVLIVLYLITLTAGPFLSFALIFTALPLIWINLIGSFVFALLVPFTALGQTLLYLDLDIRAEEEPTPAKRLRSAWRVRRAAPVSGG